MAQKHRRRIVTPRRIDANEAEHALQEQLDRLVRLADDIVVPLACEKEPQRLETCLDLGKIVARYLPRGQRTTSSPSL